MDFLIKMIKMTIQGRLLRRQPWIICRQPRCRGSFLAACALLFSFGVVSAAAAPAPAPLSRVVVEYLNMDEAEVARQSTLAGAGLQRIRPLLVPEPGTPGAGATGGIPFYGWPEGALVGDTLIVQARRWHHETEHGDIRRDRKDNASCVRLRSRDGGNTWDAPVPIPETGPYGTGITATLDGKFIVGGNVSDDLGESWKKNVVKTRISRSTEHHPDYGLVTVMGRQPDKVVRMFVAEDETKAPREITVPDPRLWDIVDPSVPVWPDGGIAIFTRTHVGPNSSGGYMTTHWSYFAQFTPENPGRDVPFENLRWRGLHTNIFNRNSDSADARYNPVSKRIEAVITKRAEGFPFRDYGYMTLTLWSISPEDLLAGSPYWRYECTLLRSQGSWTGYGKTTANSKGVNLRDGFHPYGTVIDAKRGVQHIFIYAGNRVHGGPDRGKTGVFHITRTLDTEALKAAVRKLDSFDDFFGIDESFVTLDRWEASAAPMAYWVDPGDRTVVKIIFNPLPKDIVSSGPEGLVINAKKSGYHGIHNASAIVTHNYRAEWRAKVARYAKNGDSLGVAIVYGAQKHDTILRGDGVYELDSAGKARRIAQLAMDDRWHDWAVEMRNGKVSIFLDGALVGESAARIDDLFGNNDIPVSIYARTTKSSDPAQVQIQRFKLTNLE